jgi:HSP20 family molecular chaperone IbpA
LQSTGRQRHCAVAAETNSVSDADSNREAHMAAQFGTSMQSAKESVPVRRGDGALQRQVEQVNGSIARRAFEIFDGNGRWPNNDVNDWLLAEAEVLHPVHMELEEVDSEFRVRAEVPGFDVKDLEIDVGPRNLMIAGKRETRQEEERKGKTIHSELCADQILRTIDLPADIDIYKATASLKNGVLTVDLPKAATAHGGRSEARAS